jgi:hypothetical protein
MVPDNPSNPDARGCSPNSPNAGSSSPEKNLHDFLQLMRQHPVMYLDCQPGQLTMTHLWAFTRGYEWAVAIHDIDEFASGFERGFVRFLGAKYGWNEYDHWPSLLALHIPNESEAVDRFFELADEYYRHTNE